MKSISKPLALKFLLSLSSLSLLFHFLVLFQIIPFDIVWGGKLKTQEDMHVFEAISLTINAFFIVNLALKGGYISSRISTRFVDGVLWAMAVVFGLNTIGNLFAESNLEKVIFTPITLASCLLLLVVLQKEKTAIHP